MKPSEAPARRHGDRLVTVRSGEAMYEEGASFRTNKVITSRYTVLTFLPLNLFEQFSNMANLYFLGVGVLQIIPAISTTRGIPTMYYPLFFIVCVSALRAISEDHQKHKQDKERNSYLYEVLRQGTFQPIRSGEIRVGDIIKVKQDDMVPADMIFIGSALDKGHCFIDKANLNGETTLEVVSSVIPTRSIFRDEGKHAGDLACTVMYEPPNMRFDSFRGHMTLELNGESLEVPIDGKALLMRETNLKNCEYIFGLVAYTGDDTKIQCSKGPAAKVKKSRIMRMVDKLLRVMLAAQIVLCVIGGMVAASWASANSKGGWYLDLAGENVGLVGLYAGFTWFILLAQMVPISLIVSAEMVKFIQSGFIQWDLNMYYEPIDKPTKCNTSTIHEDLGLIDYVFSDKTGTLTQNKMEFRYALLQFGDYGSKETEIAKAVARRQEELQSREAGEQVSDDRVPWTDLVRPLLSKKTKDGKPRTKGCCERSCFAPCWNQPKRHEPEPDEAAAGSANEFTAEERQAVLLALWGPPQNGETAEADAQKKFELRRYLTHMALSNTVKPYEHEGELRFQAESAEELAMVMFARSVGFLKKSQHPTVLEISTYSTDLEPTGLETESYNHLATLGFTSKRARVSVLYQRSDQGPDAPVIVMAKGQDTVILPLMKHQNGGNPRQTDLLLRQLQDLCTNGLRTLVCAHSELPLAWWDGDRGDGQPPLSKRYEDMVQRDEDDASEGHSGGRCQKAPACVKCASHELFEEIEEHAKLGYLGCMGLEDQLQLLVPDTLKDCVSAGIKVWMITGDKLETAKNIGLACNLIDPDMTPQFPAGASLDDCVEAFKTQRLIEVTGQWANLSQDAEEMGKLFDTFDLDKSGVLPFDRLVFALKSLRCSVTEEQLRELVGKHDPEGQGITPEVFGNLMNSTRLTMYEAVKYDLDEGVKRYNSIEDHEAYPISILVNRDAFQVMFPGKPKKKKTGIGVGGSKSTPLQQRRASMPEPIPQEKLDELRQKFFLLASVAKSVVFARAQPAMKKRMVTEVMERQPNALTLAIGDGANDTDMIMAAHIGVGIAGVEGTAATNAADYAIGSFRILHTLLFVHGYWCYHRVADMVDFIFYKASMLAFSQYFYGFYSGFSGQQYYNDFLIQTYNVAYTALPVLALAVLDKRLPAATLENNPRAYREAKHKAFSPVRFWGWIVRGVVHSWLIYWLPFAVCGQNNVVTSDGKTVGLWFMSSQAFMGMVMIASTLILFDMFSITLVHFITIALSILALFVFMLALAIVLGLNPDLFGVVQQLWATPSTWLVLILLVAMPCLFELAWRYLRVMLRPSYGDILRERIHIERQRKNWLLTKHTDSSDDQAGEAIALRERAANKVVERAGDDSTWVQRKTKNKRKAQFAAASAQLSALAGQKGDGTIVDNSEEALKSALVRTMLRFRNLTGSQFDSAAQARYQRHDSVNDGYEHKQPE